MMDTHLIIVISIIAIILSIGALIISLRDSRSIKRTEANIRDVSEWLGKRDMSHEELPTDLIEITNLSTKPGYREFHIRGTGEKILKKYEETENAKNI